MIQSHQPFIELSRLDWCPQQHDITIEKVDSDRAQLLRCWHLEVLRQLTAIVREYVLVLLPQFIRQIYFNMDHFA